MGRRIGCLGICLAAAIIDGVTSTLGAGGMFFLVLLLFGIFESIYNKIVELENTHIIYSVLSTMMRYFVIYCMVAGVILCLILLIDGSSRSDKNAFISSPPNNAYYHQEYCNTFGQSPKLSYPISKLISMGYLPCPQCNPPSIGNDDKYRTE